VSDIVTTSDSEPVVESGDPREQALRRLKQRRDFRTHAFTYLVVNTMVWGIWIIIGLSADAWFPWPAFVTLGWGIGLIMNAWDVYMRRPISEEDIRREMDRLQAGS
jgi:fatty acid desaturase